MAFSFMRSAQLFRVLWIAIVFTTSILGAQNASAFTDCASLFAPTIELNFPDIHASYLEKLETLPAPTKNAFQRLERSLFFIDFDHNSPVFAEILTGNKKLPAYDREKTFAEKYFPTFRKWFSSSARREFDVAAIYDRGGWARSGEPAFENFSAATDFLSAEKDPINFDTFKKLHSILMRKGIENVPSYALGKIRNSYVVGLVPLQRRLNEAQHAEVIGNPYLGFTEISHRFNGYSTIDYPTIQNVKSEALERIKYTHPEVVDRVLLFQEKFKQDSSAVDYDLNRSLVEALVRERFSWFITEKGRLGDLSNPSQNAQFIELAAQFYRDLVSIHPFVNGNGRTCRFVLRRVFEEVGLAPPRLLDVDADLYDPFPDWVRQVQQGVENSKFLYQDLIRRIELGLPIEQSPELILPMFARSVEIDQRNQGKEDAEVNSRDAELNAEQFQSYLIEQFRQNPSIYRAFKESPVNSLKTLSELFKNWAKKNRVDYLHESDGLREIGIHFISPDFLAAFNRSMRADVKAWEGKMEAWYTSQIVWRGISYRDRVVEQAEILNMFTQLHSQLVSNQVARVSENSYDTAIRKDFRRYNKDVFNDNVYAMAKDHTETGPMYGESYGYSTSKREEVAKAFAMGAMVIAPYGQHQQFQHLLKSRIVIGMRRGIKDVDVGRLHQLNQEFKYKYGRQAEVMGIGGADPDSVMFVKQVNAAGEVEFTYARNPLQPNQVWKVNGDFKPVGEQVPLHTQIVDVFEI